jgi:hypothetical protein
MYGGIAFSYCKIKLNVLIKMHCKFITTLCSYIKTYFALNCCLNFATDFSLTFATFNY